MRFEVTVPEDRRVRVYRCNCSVCFMKQNHHFVVPESQFHLIKGESESTEYRFHTKVARHLFCKICGVQSYYQPRSHPDGLAVTLYCLDKGHDLHVEWKDFDGEHWEEQILQSDTTEF